MAGVSCSVWVLKYFSNNMVIISMLAQDTTHQNLDQEKTKTVTLEHVSLAKMGPSIINTQTLVEVSSIMENLMAVGFEVSVGQPLLLVGEVGVGKTSLVMEWGARTEREVLNLQVRDNTDTRQLVGLYWCTDVPCLGGQIRMAPGFQLFLTQRELVGSVMKELALLVRTVPVTSLRQEGIRTVIRRGFPKLEDITEKIMRMFLIIITPQDHTDYPHLGKLVNTLRASRQISVRDLVQWYTRVQDTFTSNPTSQQLAEILYQDNVDIFCRFIPDKNIRTFMDQEIAFTLNSKDHVAFFSTVNKPAISVKASDLQIGGVLVRLSASSPSLHPLHSVFSVTCHTSTLLESVVMSGTNMEPILLLGETEVGKTSSFQFLAEKTGRKLMLINMNQQSDSADLLGVVKPASLSCSLHSFGELFTFIFCNTCSSLDISRYSGSLDTCFRDMCWSEAMQFMSHFLKVGLVKVTKTDQMLVKRWNGWRVRINTGQEMVMRTDSATVFAIIEGTLTEALKISDCWILLDEVTLDPDFALGCLSQLLESEGSITLYEAGEYNSIPRQQAKQISNSITFYSQVT